MGEAARTIPIRPHLAVEGPRSDLRDSLKQFHSKELVFGVVGYAGSGTSFVAGQIRLLLGSELKDKGYKIHGIKASELLNQFAKTIGRVDPPGANKIERVSFLQGVGDELRQRSREYGAVAAYAVRRIQNLRSAGGKSANIYILDSLKHPGEVDLLRHVYGEAFCLVGVGCRPDVRKKRLQRKFEVDENSKELEDFIDRDAEDSEHKYGQQVNATFHLADYFVDNTHDSADNQRYQLADQIKRLFDILFTLVIQRPHFDERGMYHAHAAAMRSSCMSRQVGASILDRDGNLLSVGSNEVPRYGGGAYDGSEQKDHRCFAKNRYCSNTVEQNKILEDVISRLGRANLLKDGVTSGSVAEAIKSTRIKSLVEFSRSVHAEMDAIISLARAGTRLPPGSTLYSTTYPCHSCARHIVAAGIERLVYLEPYAKSMAISLHDDSIADNLPPEESEGRVKFVPYQGVSPRLFSRVYLKVAELKDQAGNLVSPEGPVQEGSFLWIKAYTDLEKDGVKPILS